MSQPYGQVQGWLVRDGEGENLGHVEDVLVDGTGGQVRFLKVAHGGSADFGASHSLLPIEAVVSMADGVVTVETSARQVAGAPRSDRNGIENRQQIDELYGHYGYPPPWAPTPAPGGGPAGGPRRRG